MISKSKDIWQSIHSHVKKKTEIAKITLQMNLVILNFKTQDKKYLVTRVNEKNKQHNET